MGLAIKKLAGEANSMSIRAIAAQLKNELPNESWYPSRTTIQRYLARQGLVHKKSTLKPPLNATNRAKRLAFATEWLPNGLEWTGVVIWSDETTIKSRPSSHRVSSYVHATVPAPVQDRIQGGGISVMF
jgi:hypothetical protein